MTESTAGTPSTGEQTDETTTTTQTGAGEYQTETGGVPGQAQPDKESRDAAAKQYQEDSEWMVEHPNEARVRGPVEGVGGESAIPPQPEEG